MFRRVATTSSWALSLLSSRAIRGPVSTRTAGTGPFFQDLAQPLSRLGRKLPSAAVHHTYEGLQPLIGRARLFFLIRQSGDRLADHLRASLPPLHRQALQGCFGLDVQSYGRHRSLSGSITVPRRDCRNRGERSRHLENRTAAVRISRCRCAHAGVELDLLVVRVRRRIGFELKRTASPRVTPSIRTALDHLHLERVDVVYPGEHTSRWPTGGSDRIPRPLPGRRHHRRLQASSSMPLMVSPPRRKVPTACRKLR